jgi:hypothetical protein
VSAFFFAPRGPQAAERAIRVNNKNFFIAIVENAKIMFIFALSKPFGV